MLYLEAVTKSELVLNSTLGDVAGRTTNWCMPRNEYMTTSETQLFLFIGRTWKWACNVFQWCFLNSDEQESSQRTSLATLLEDSTLLLEVTSFVCLEDSSFGPDPLTWIGVSRLESLMIHREDKEIPIHKSPLISSQPMITYLSRGTVGPTHLVLHLFKD